MQLLSNLVKVNVPNYLAGLPVPDSFGGWFRLGFKDWLQLVPPTLGVAGAGYVLYLAFCPQARLGTRRVNYIIKKENPKVVDSIDIEDITDKAVLCRCWKSKNWPYCDGAHGPHNRETGDNVGPAVIAHKKK